MRKNPRNKIFVLGPKFLTFRCEKKLQLHFFGTPCKVTLNKIPIELSSMNMIVKIMWILYSRIQWGIFNPLQVMRIQPIEDDTVESVARWKRGPGSRNAAHSSLVVAQFYLVFRWTIYHVLTLKKKMFYFSCFLI